VTREGEGRDGVWANGKREYWIDEA